MVGSTFLACGPCGKSVYTRRGGCSLSTFGDINSVDFDPFLPFSVKPGRGGGWWDALDRSDIEILAFGVVAAIGCASVVWLAAAERRWGRGMITLLALAAGVALPCEILYDSLDLNLIEVWRINLAKHAGFYEAMPRSYLPWIVIDPMEFAVVSGPGLFLLAMIHVIARGGEKRPRRRSNSGRLADPADHARLEWSKSKRGRSTLAVSRADGDGRGGSRPGVPGSATDPWAPPRHRIGFFRDTFPGRHGLDRAAFADRRLPLRKRDS